MSSAKDEKPFSVGLPQSPAPMEFSYLGDVFQLSWLTLRSLGNSPLVKMTILVPVIGYLVLFNERFIEIARISFDDGAIIFDGEKPWRLFIIYFGLCSLAVASIIYNLRCPVQIKHYDNETDYIAATLPQLSALRFMQLVILLSEVDSGRMWMIQKGLDISDENIEEGHLEENYRKELLSYYYCVLNNIRPLPRITSTFMFFIGFILLSIPAMNVFYNVCMAAIE